MLTGVESPANGIRDYYDDAARQGSRTIAHMKWAERSLLDGVLQASGTCRRGTPRRAADRRERTPGPSSHAENRGGFGFWEGFESGFLINNPWLHGTRLPEPVRFDGYQSDVVCERRGRVPARHSRARGSPS